MIVTKDPVNLTIIMGQSKKTVCSKYGEFEVDIVPTPKS